MFDKHNKTEMNINISQSGIQENRESRQQVFLRENELAYKILDRLYECRNLEITNLWQRSAFLIGILLVIYTGYGVLLFETFKECNFNPEDINLPANILGVIISCLGVIFSILWIKMGKGSKAWYEVYENYIAELDNKLSNSKGANILNCKASYFSMGKMNTFVNNNILHTNAGAYSPSKINIVIGQYSLIIFFLTLVFHFVLCNISLFYKLGWCSIFIIILQFIVFFVLYNKLELRKLFKSSENTNSTFDSLVEEKKEIEGKKIKILKKIKEDASINKFLDELIYFYINEERCTLQQLRDEAKLLYEKYCSQEKSPKNEEQRLFEQVLETYINDLCYNILKTNYNPASFMSTKSGFLGQ